MKQFFKPVGAMAALSLLLHVSPSFAQGPRFERPGLKEMTPEENRRLHKKKIKNVRPNRMGLERVNKERFRRGEAPLFVDPQLPEMETEETLSGASYGGMNGDGGGATLVPAQVDNSALPSFPPIVNQGSLGSCVPFSTTYYLMSHEVCLTLGCNNKTLGQKIFSPKWTYNMINDGVDDGSYFSDAFRVIEKHGAATMGEFPYDSNYRSWSMSSAHWKNAIQYRMNTSTYASINTDAGISNIKQVLANGHVVAFATYINSWVYRTVQANPQVASNPFVGQQIATYLNGKVSPHAMVIVGYDDNIWTDANGNGVVEAQEKGAFKVANSFGAAWKNQGYAWITFDAFRATSTVPGFAPVGRVQATQSGNVYHSSYTAYKPTLLAEVTFSHLKRSELSLVFGSSSNTSTSASKSWTPAALVNRGGSFAFDGTTVEKEATFYFDISSLAADVSAQKFYLTLKDSLSGSSLTAKSFKIIDPDVGNTLLAANGVPMYVDAGQNQLVAGTTFVDTTPPTVPTNLKVTVSTSRRSAKMSLSWTASTDNVGVAKYNVYRNGVLMGSTTSRSYSDSRISRGVTYTYTVSAVDAKGNQSAQSLPVSAKW